MGDWDGNHTTTPGLVQVAAGRLYWTLHNQNSNGDGDFKSPYRYGKPDDTPVVGDWDGDGRQTPGVVRKDGNQWQWILVNQETNGADVTEFRYGDVGSGSIPVVGDWDGDGTQTPGVARKKSGHWVWDISNQNSDGRPQYTYTYGKLGDIPIVGDWDGNDGMTTPGVIRNIGNKWRWLLTDAKNGGVAEAWLWYPESVTP